MSRVIEPMPIELTGAATGNLAAGATELIYDLKGASRVSIVLRNTGGSNAITTASALLSPTGTTYVANAAATTALGTPAANTNTMATLTGLSSRYLKLSLASTSGTTYAIEIAAYP